MLETTIITIIIITVCIAFGFFCAAITDYLWKAWLWLILPKEKKQTPTQNGPQTTFTAPNKQLPTITPIDPDSAMVDEEFQKWMAKAAASTKDRYIDAPRFVKGYEENE